uniref:GH5_13 / GH5 n=1 Tax=uncultured Armatimonadetes bacterium TaxID=157466 RepID=A0A6J4JS77_9BACT|nr:GH5_13 / GH5 [uncultured Armatimonadetes bacterium]
MNRLVIAMTLVFHISTAAAASAAAAVSERWSEQKANDWYRGQPWLVGSNYNPASAINQLEMWQADTFDPHRIDRELGWAESLGMNTMRVYLHDLLWQQDARGFKKRIDTFLQIAQRHNIRPMFVLFDSCWDPFPRLGRQRPPTPGVHNSGWVQNPGADALQDPAQYPRLEAYVKGVVGAFARDPRVLAWDVWNEPDNTNNSSYGKREPANKVALVQALLPKVFAWARAAGPQQPLTCAVWKGDWSSPEKMTAMDRIQIESSDVISFHNYDNPAEFEKRVKWLLPYNRPILCTEYMARGNRSTFQGTLPIAKKYRVAAINWGLVAGKTQTYLPWDSWQRPYTDREPSVWFHEVFYPNGLPYRFTEVAFIREMTGKAAAGAAPARDGRRAGVGSRPATPLRIAPSFR